MNATYPVAAVAELIGEPARAAMLIALADGRALPAGELAQAAGVSAQSASGHLSKLVVGGLLFVSREGRHRCYRMSGPEVGHAIEALGAVALGWFVRLPETRAVRVTHRGARELADRLGIAAHV